MGVLCLTLVALRNDLNAYPIFSRLLLTVLAAMILLLPLTLLSFSLTSLVHAGSFNYGQACSVDHQRLQVGTYQFMTDCDSMTFCNSSSLCDWRGCRRDEFPLGYDETKRALPPRCDTGSFCPDEEDACQTVLAVGSPCQLNRDGELCMLGS